MVTLRLFSAVEEATMSLSDHNISSLSDIGRIDMFV